MDFTGIAWWVYVLTVVGGFGFGILQSLLVKKSLMGEKRHQWLYMLKYLLWGGVLCGLALLSVPVMLVFAVAASTTMLGSTAVLYHKARKEAP